MTRVGAARWQRERERERERGRGGDKSETYRNKDSPAGTCVDEKSIKGIASPFVISRLVP